MQTSAAADTCLRLIDRSQKPGQRWRTGSVCADADGRAASHTHTAPAAAGGELLPKHPPGCLAEHRNLAASKQQELLSHNTTGQKSKLKVSEGQAPSQASGGGSPPGFFQLLPAPSISGSGRWNPSLSLVFPVQAGPTPVWPQPN